MPTCWRCGQYANASDTTIRHWELLSPSEESRLRVRIAKQPQGSGFVAVDGTWIGLCPQCLLNQDRDASINSEEALENLKKTRERLSNAAYIIINSDMSEEDREYCTKAFTAAFELLL